MANRPRLDVAGLGKRFEGAGAMERALTLGRAENKSVQALSGVTLHVNVGEIVGLLGPNGSGKTTLLRCAAGLLAPTAGTVRAFGLDPTVERNGVRGRIGLVMRDDRAFHHRLSGRENLRLFARLQRLPRRVREDRIDEALTDADIADVADRPYRTYSAGMRQRLGFARALLGRPELLLLDEATSGLDPGLRVAFRQKLRARADAGIAALYATHDLDEARDMCDRLVLLDRGAVVASGPWSEVREPALDTFGIRS